MSCSCLSCECHRLRWELASLRACRETYDDGPELLLVGEAG